MWLTWLGNPDTHAFYTSFLKDPFYGKRTWVLDVSVLFHQKVSFGKDSPSFQHFTLILILSPLNLTPSHPSACTRVKSLTQQVLQRNSENLLNHGTRVCSKLAWWCGEGFGIRIGFWYEWVMMWGEVPFPTEYVQVKVNSGEEVLVSSAPSLEIVFTNLHNINLLP